MDIVMDPMKLLITHSSVLLKILRLKGLKFGASIGSDFMQIILYYYIINKGMNYYNY